MESIIGILSPNGDFYECEDYGHLYLSEKLCKDLYNLEFCRITQAEDYLIKKGFIVFQARHVFNRCYYKITDKQFEFIELHADKFNSMQQEDINSLLLQDEDWSDEE